jgi:hypothetical protein
MDVIGEHDVPNWVDVGHPLRHSKCKITALSDGGAWIL